MTLLERLDWILQARGTNPNRLSTDAGLSRTHVRVMREKLAKGKFEPEASTLDAIARAANVSVAWLVSGIEPREPYEGPATPANETASAPAPSTVVVRDGAQVINFRRFRDLPGWAEAEAEAKRVRGNDLPEYCWDYAGGLAADRWPTVITAETVYRFARTCFDQMADEERITREREEVRAAKAAWRAQQERTRREG